MIRVLVLLALLGACAPAAQLPDGFDSSFAF
jgi:hypothetical protein